MWVNDLSFIGMYIVKTDPLCSDLQYIVFVRHVGKFCSFASEMRDPDMSEKNGRCASNTMRRGFITNPIWGTNTWCIFTSENPIFSLVLKHYGDNSQKASASCISRLGVGGGVEGEKVV